MRIRFTGENEVFQHKVFQREVFGLDVTNEWLDGVVMGLKNTISGIPNRTPCYYQDRSFLIPKGN